MKGSIKRRGKSWRGRIEVGVDPATGKRRFRSVTKPTKKQVEKELARLLTEIEAGSYIDPKVTSFGEWLDIWFENNKEQKRPSTQERYQGIIDKHLRPKLGRINLQRLQATHIEQYYRESKLSASGLELHHVVIQSALDSAVKKKLVTDNAARLIDARPKSSKESNADVRANCWTSDEAKTFLATAKEEGPQQAAFYTVALEIGIRKAELCGLMWEDVDVAACTIALKHQLTKEGPSPEFGPLKSGEERTLEITPELADFLSTHKAHQAKLKMRNRRVYRDHNLVFAKEWKDLTKTNQRTMLGDSLPVRSIGVREFAKLVKKAEVPSIKFHGLRHTAATLALIAGVDVKTVSYRLGHSKTQITLDLYSHVVPELQKKAVAKIRSILHG